MAQLDRTADIDRLAVARLAVARLAVDRTRSGRHGGSIGLVLLVAIVLAGCSSAASSCLRYTRAAPAAVPGWTR